MSREKNDATASPMSCHLFVCLFVGQMPCPSHDQSQLSRVSSLVGLQVFLTTRLSLFQWSRNASRRHLV